MSRPHADFCESRCTEPTECRVKHACWCQEEPDRPAADAHAGQVEMERVLRLHNDSGAKWGMKPWCALCCTPYPCPVWQLTNGLRRLLDWRLDKAIGHFDRLRALVERAGASDEDLALLDRYQGWFLNLRDKRVLLVIPGNGEASDV